MTDLIGRKATIVGYSESGDRVSSDNESVAHICLDIEDGPRVFFQATDPDVVLRFVEEPRQPEEPEDWSHAMGHGA